MRTAWFSLDPENDDLSTFFTRFTAAIEAVLPGALSGVATGLDLETMPAHQYVNALAAACLELPHPVVTVLDDYHLIVQPGTHAVLLHLIRYASDKLHLVIVTRHDPPLRIERQRARNQVAEVRSANLRLTAQETDEFLDWKPVLWYVKGEYDGKWLGDVARSNVSDNDKRFHHWGQSERGMADLFDRVANQGDVILDPFLGGAQVFLQRCLILRHKPCQCSTGTIMTATCQERS